MREGPDHGTLAGVVAPPAVGANERHALRQTLYQAHVPRVAVASIPKAKEIGGFPSQGNGRLAVLDHAEVDEERQHRLSPVFIRIAHQAFGAGAGVQLHRCAVTFKARAEPDLARLAGAQPVDGPDHAVGGGVVHARRRGLLEDHVAGQPIMNLDPAQLHGSLVGNRDREDHALVHGVLVGQAALDAKVGRRMQVDGDRGKLRLAGQHVELPLEPLDLLTHGRQLALNGQNVLDGFRSFHDLEQLTLGRLRVAQPRFQVGELGGDVAPGHILGHHLAPVRADTLDGFVETIHRNPHRQGADRIGIVAADVRVRHEGLGDRGHEAADHAHAFRHVSHHDADGGRANHAPLGPGNRRPGVRLRRGSRLGRRRGLGGHDLFDLDLHHLFDQDRDLLHNDLFDRRRGRGRSWLGHHRFHLGLRSTLVALGP